MMMRTLITTSLALLAFSGAFSQANAEEKPHWIWSSKNAKDGEKVYFRKTIKIDGKVSNAKLVVTADNEVTAFLNGKRVGQSSDWKDPSYTDVTKELVQGDNILSIAATNADGQAAMVAKLTYKNGPATIEVVSDSSWKQGSADGWNWIKKEFDDSSWKPAVVVGVMGQAPWGDVFAGAGKANKENVIAPEDLKLLPGFKAELVYVVPKGQQGSWVSMTSDDKGRLIASDQGGTGIYRITPMAPGGDSEDTKVERIDVDVSAAQGLLWHKGSLYVAVNTNSKNAKTGKNASGVYRVTDTNNDDKFDAVETIKALNYGGEHGPHAIIPGPDGKIYFCAGNHTDVPSQFDTYIAPKLWQEDVVLPHHLDPNGHARDKKAPGGWIARFEPDGKNWELFSIGFRNQYDMGFNSAGELFAYDADMEWDLGTPWYRPTRLCHVTSGSEFGWRTGSGKWPEYYPDSLPAINNIGPGSPTGVVFGTGAKFPEKYQRAIYLNDWTYGTVYAIHMTPKGASYETTREDFIYGKPFPVTDSVIANDGAMYIAIGGRGTQSAVYRLTYTGKESIAAAPALTVNDDITLRRSLEKYHGKQDPAAVAAALPHLGHADRYIRFAARTALEHQPVASWSQQVLSNTNTVARITGIIGIARSGEKSLKEPCLNALLEIDPNVLEQSVLLDYVRAIGLVGIRLGAVNPTIAQKLAAKIDGLYPSNDAFVNRELAGILAVLGSPMMVQKTIERLGAEEVETNQAMKVLVERNDRYGKAIDGLLNSKPQTQGMVYALALSAATNGWTPDLRKQYFTWFIDAENNGNGGNSFKGFIRAIQKDAMNTVPQSERAKYAPDKLQTGKAKAAPVAIPVPKGPGKNWTLAELEPIVKKGLSKRNFENGKNMFLATQCTICHRFNGEGAAVGPDITSVGTKFSPRDLLEAIIEPSKVISDQYQNHAVITKDGATLVGKLMGEENGQILIATSPFDLTNLTSVSKDNVATTMPMQVSVMPPALINRLNQDEVLDLIAYLIAAGNSDDKVFK